MAPPLNIRCEARLNVVRAFEQIGLELFVEPGDGIVCARFPHIEDSLALAEASQRDGLMLAPGTVFRPHLERSSLRRNSTYVLTHHFRMANQTETVSRQGGFFARMPARLVCPQLRKCRVRRGRYAWCQ
jgi:hypothetical protein